MKKYSVEKGRKWKIGDVTIESILEKELRLSDMGLQAEGQFPTMRRGKEIEWIMPNFSGDNYDLITHIQSFLIKSNGKNILVDTCANFPGTTYENNLKLAGCIPQDINIVLFTHLHYDHNAKNTKMVHFGELAPYFPNARYLFVKENYEFLKDMYDNPGKRWGDPNHDQIWPYTLHVMPLVEQGKVDFIDYDFTLDNDIHLYPTPGHMPGMVGIVIKSKGDSAFIGGDIIGNPLQLTQLDVNSAWEHDPKQAEKTRRKLFEELADTDTMYFGAHVAGLHGYFITKDNTGGYKLVEEDDK
jgi:glyoxylase-like metal-dependent hydrolase (beta-lactamase superfamily II)